MARAAVDITAFTADNFSEWLRCGIRQIIDAPDLSPAHMMASFPGIPTDIAEEEGNLADSLINLYYEIPEPAQTSLVEAVPLAVQAISGQTEEELRLILILLQVGKELPDCQLMPILPGLKATTDAITDTDHSNFMNYFACEIASVSREIQRVPPRTRPTELVLKQHVERARFIFEFNK